MIASVSVLVLAGLAIADKHEQQSDPFQSNLNEIDKAMLASMRSVAVLRAEAIAQLVQGKGVSMIGVQSERSQNIQLQNLQFGSGVFALLAVFIALVGICLISLCLFTADDAPRPVEKGIAKLNVSSSSPVVAQHYQPAHVPSPFTTHVPSPLTSAMTRSMPFIDKHLSPQSASRASWTLGNTAPPLCPSVAPSQSLLSFWVSKASLRNLYDRCPVELVDGYNKVVVYAKLSDGPEGNRLVLACEPSCREPVATVGPFTSSSNFSSTLSLGPEALLHGPKRELYGPFEHFGEGFTVGHFSRVGNVFTVLPRKVPNGLRLEASAGETKLASLWMTNYKSRCQIDVNPGSDSILMFAAFLASCLAKNSLLDDVAAT
mmetsp:Transcript_103410/g.163137  ORF Transcript_103410/g.163137 Transcript_103410/m.163137 type:complete len:374 (+) Transcript_103410:40-1161(+)